MALDVAMTKPLRSPVLGYNHNLRYRGRVFHVQTEDSGPVNPHLFTHLFYEGTILSSKKHQYNAADPEDSVKLMMQQLHKAMIRELTHGEHDQRVVHFFAARGQDAFMEPPPSAQGPFSGGSPAPPAAAAAGSSAPPAAPAPAAEAGPPAAARAAPPSPTVIQVTGVVAGSIDTGPARRRIPSSATPRVQATPRPVVMVKPTDMKRPPMAFSHSADGVVVQRNVVITVGGNGQVPSSADAPRIRPAAVIGEPGTVSPPQSAHSPQSAAASAGVRARIPSPIEKPFTDLVSDKSLDEVILEYLSDDNDPDRR